MAFDYVHSDDDDENIGESTALLASQPDNAPKSTITSRSRCTWPWIHVVALCIAISIIVDIGDQLFRAPNLRLYESIACTDHYLLHDPSLVGNDSKIPEELCKIDPVQQRIAMIYGWQEFFDSIPALLLPVIFGHLTDTYGRKWFTVLAFWGYTLSAAWRLFALGILHLPLEFVWLSSLFHLMGGGPMMAITLMTIIVADVAPPDKRSAAFFYRFTSELTAEFVVPPVASVLMKRTLWVPLIIAQWFMTFGALLTIIVPETLQVKGSLPGYVSSSESQPGDPSSVDALLSEDPDFHSRWKNWLSLSKNFFKFVTRDKFVVALLIAFPLLRVGRQAYHMFLQYVSIRYGWTIAQAGFLLSLRATVNIVLFTAVLPFIANVTFRNLRAISKDLRIARLSITLMILGTVVVSLSPTPIPMVIGLTIYTLGAGFPPILRSLITAIIESDHACETSDIGRLYALISVMEGLGSLVAGPGIAWTLRLGLSLGGTWVGLPFATAAFLFAVVSQIVFLIKV